MKNRKSSTFILIAALTLAIVLGTAVQSMAAETKAEGTVNLKITTELGTAANPVTGGKWIEVENGRQMYLKNGKALKNLWAYIQNREVKVGQPLCSKYLFGADGVMLTGWQQVNNVWYYLNETADGPVGACVEGAVKDTEKMIR